jgi:hypothetical protein
MTGSKIVYTPSRPCEDGSTPPVDLPIPLCEYQSGVAIDRGFSFITNAAAKSGAVCGKGCSTRLKTAIGGPIQPTDRRPTRPSRLAAVSSAISIARSRRAALCPRRSGGPTTRIRQTARASSMCSPSRRTGRVRSSEPLGSHERRSRSERPMSSKTSNDCSCYGGLRPHEGIRRQTEGGDNRKSTTEAHRKCSSRGRKAVDRVDRSVEMKILRKVVGALDIHAFV